MSYITGTASGFLDLLNIFDSFVISTGHCWGLKFTGNGTGRLVGYLGTGTSIAETITVTATSSTSFTVSGAASGNLGTATVGALHTNSKCKFTITAGSVPFSAGDYFTFNTTPPWTKVRLQGCSLPITNRYTSFAVGNTVQGLFTDNSSTNYAFTGSDWVRINCEYNTTVRAFAVEIGFTPGPSNFTLQASDDGNSWTTVHTVTGLTWDANDRFRYFYPSNPPAKRYWRINFAGSSGTFYLQATRFYGNVDASYPVDARVEGHWVAPGIGGDQQINIGIYTSVSETEGYYNLVFRGFRFVDQVVANQSILLNEGSSSTALRLRNLPLQYWIVAHGGRAIIMVRHTAQYQAAYVGFGLPYEPPANHQYPCVIAATGSETGLYSSESTLFTNPHKPGEFSFFACSPSNEWHSYANITDGASGTVTHGEVYPSRSFGSTSTNLDGSLPVIPCIIVKNQASPMHWWGELDGYSWTTGFGNQPEYLLRRGQIDWISIPNVTKIGPDDYGAIALD